MTNKKDVCESFCINEEAVLMVKGNMPAGQEIALLADTFKLLGDRTRICILLALMQKELCVCDLATVLQMSVSAISHQLRLLRSARLVKYRKVGRNAYYSIDDAHVSSIISQGWEHVFHR